LIADNKALRKAVYQRMAAPVREKQGLINQIKQIEQNNKSLDQRIEALRQEISKEAAEHAANLERLNAEHLKEKGLLIQNSDAAIEKIRAAHDDEKAKLRGQIIELDSQINSMKRDAARLNNEMARHRNENADLSQALRTCYRTNTQLKGDLKTAQAELDSATQQLVSKDRSISELKQRVDEFTAELAQAKREKQQVATELKQCLARKAKEPEIAFADRMNKMLIERLS